MQEIGIDSRCIFKIKTTKLFLGRKLNLCSWENMISDNILYRFDGSITSPRHLDSDIKAVFVTATKMEISLGLYCVIPDNLQ